jgi:hypothetical protein
VLQKLRELYNTVHNIGAVDAAAKNTNSTAVTTTTTTIIIVLIVAHTKSYCCKCYYGHCYY